MPWKAPGGNGGGPWGNGPNDQTPWGRRPNGGAGGPGFPDFDQMIRRAQGWFRRMMSGRNGPVRLIGIALLAILAIWGLTGFYVVTPNQLGVVQRFGKFTDLTQPGLNYHLPSPIETAVTLDVTDTQTTTIGLALGAAAGQGSADNADSLMLTGDQNIIDINFTVYWRIKDPAQYLFNVRDPANIVQVAAESAMREVIGELQIMPALSTAKQTIIDKTQERTQELLDSYKAGVTIVSVQLLKVDPPAQVIDAFNDVQRAKSDQQRLANEADAYQNSVVPQAKGDAQRIILQAEAYKAQVVDQAQGDAQRFLSVLTAYRAAPDVTARRLYLDTMEDVLKSTPKIIVDSNLRGVVPYLPLPGLQPPASAPAPAAGNPTAPSAAAPSLTAPPASSQGGPSAAATGGTP